MKRDSSWLTLGLDRPRLVLLGLGLLMGGALLLLALRPLGVSTSRRGLVSTDSPYQARLFRHYAEFGRSEFAALVVNGGSPDAQRALIDRFESELAKYPEFRGRVLGKVALDDVAETLLLWRPELLELFAFSSRDAEPAGSDPWVLWCERAARGITDQLSGEAPDAASPEPSAKQAASRLGRAADAVVALRRAIEGDGRLAVGQLGFGSGTSQVDEQGYLVGRGGSYRLVLIFPNVQSDEGRELRPVVQHIREARDRALAAVKPKGVRAELTGAPALAVDELDVIKAGGQVTSVLSTAGILLLLLWVFRSLRHTAITLVPLLAGMLITLGLVDLIYGRLNLVTSSFMSVLLGLGIDFGVHLFHRYKEARSEGAGLDPALRSTLIGTGPAIAVGAVTTMGAFLASTVTEFAAFRELGIITALGLVVVLLCSFLLLPILVRLFGGQPRVWLHEVPGTLGLIALVRRRARPVLVATGVLTLLALVSLWRNPPHFNGRYFDFLPANAESYRALQVILRDGTPPAEAHFKVDSFERARELAQALRKQPEVSVVQTPSDLFPPETADGLAALRRALDSLGGRAPSIPPLRPDQASARLEAFTELGDAFDELSFALRQAGQSGEAATRAARELAGLVRWLKSQPDSGTRALSRMTDSLEDALVRATRVAKRVVARGGYAPPDLPPVFKARFASKDQKRLALHVYPAGDIWEPAFADRFAAKLYSFDPEVAGAALNVVPHQRYITEGFERATVYSLLFVTIVVWITFRRLSDMILSLLPVVLGWVWMLALMQPLGIEFTAANMVALPLLLGIGIDTGVHIVHRARHGDDKSLSALMLGTGTAVAVAAVTNVIGYAALIAADYRAMQGLGLLLSLGIGLSLLTSIVVLPALLLATKRAE